MRGVLPHAHWHHARGRGEYEAALAELPDLVLADYRLPDIDGLAALDRLRERDPDVPFVVVSGAITETFAIEALRRGATDYVLKDRLERLGPVATRALDETRVRRELREQRRLVLEIGHRAAQQLGADLHDGVGQDLAALSLQLEALAAHARRQAPSLAGRVEDSRRLLARAVRGLKGLARSLAPVHLWPGAVEATLRELARDAESIYGIRCQLQSEGNAASVDEDTGVHLYRVAQEAIGNAARHGHARHVAVRLRTDPDVLELEIADDGAGIELERARAGEGLGLRLMEYRARAIGARLYVGPGTDRGTVVLLVRGAVPSAALVSSSA